AHFQLAGIPPAPRGAPQIEVAFDIDSNGIVHVSAKDLGTGREQRVDVRPTSGLSEDEIKRFIAEADKHRAEDVAKRDWADLRNNADTLIYGAERALVEFGAKLEATAKGNVQRELESCKRLLESSQDLAAAREAVSRL